jgi:hypothetical protein
MRLLQLQGTDRFSLVEFINDDIPQYAILSHTWGPDNEEVTFEDILKSTGKGKPGYAKIRFCAKQAAQDNIRYFWVDTCCIDKSNSAELSESINSMFQWYKRAHRCYVYLSDLGDGWLRLRETNPHALQTGLQACRWFTRGWTLQELIAPHDLLFYSSTWRLVGSKKELLEPISNITRVDPLVLSNRCELNELSVAKKLSWAAHRQTRRIEDQAYCLLGLLDVNIPLIYGEGEKAFMRLQDELLKLSADASLFIWFRGIDSGILAPSTRHFHPCGKIVRIRVAQISHAWEMTHRGLRITLPILRPSQRDAEATLLGILACRVEDDYTNVLALHLREHGQENTWGEKVMGCSIEKCTMECNNPQSGLHLVNVRHLGAARSGTIILPHNNFQSSVSLSALRLTSSIWIRNQPASFKMIQAHPRHQWNLETMTMNRYRSYAMDDKQVGAALFKNESGLKIVVCFAVSASEGFVKVSGERQSLRRMCENISVSPSLRYSIQSCAVHHTRLMDNARPIRVQARLKQCEVMGENVWIIDLALLS